ncbi:hypothetical protein THAOC_26943, partial [Thalassiosira oceanica]
MSTYVVKHAGRRPEVSYGDNKEDLGPTKLQGPQAMKGRVVVTLPLLLRSSAFVSPRRQQQKRGAPTSIFAEEGVNGSFVNGSSKVNGSGDQSSDKSSGTSSVPSVGEVTSD